MTVRQALSFVRKHGVVLEAAAGAVPSLVEAILGAPVRGSWWSHPRGREIVRITRAVRASPGVLTCRVVAGKVTFVHRRLWAPLVRLAGRFPAERLAQVREVHLPSGRHAVREVAFPRWVPAGVSREAASLSEEEASRELGAWCAS